MSDPNNPENEFNWSYPEKWGFTIIGLLIISFIVMILVGFCIKESAPESHHIHVYLTPDSIQNGVKDLYTRAEVDTLINILQNHEAILDQKYQYILEQHEEEDKMRMWVTIIVGLILSIAAFFGFKNITELKQQCSKDASSIASDIAKTTAESVAQDKAEKTATQIATDVAKKETADLVKESSEPIATKIAQKTAEDIVKEYLSLNLKKTVEAQLSYIQETIVFKNLKKEIETIVQLEIERIHSLIPEPSSTQDQAREENHNQVEPEINLEILDENPNEN